MPRETLFETDAPQPAKPRVKLDLIGDELQLEWKQGELGAVVFLGLWLVAWSAGCGMLAWHLWKEPTWFMLLFATPFVASWFAVAGIIVYQLFGRQRLILNRHELRLTGWALIAYANRVTPLAEVEWASPDKVAQSNDGDTTWAGVLKIATMGQPMEFARGIDDDEAIWLAEVVNRCLERLAPRREAANLPSECSSLDQISFDDEPPAECGRSGRFVYRQGRDRPQQPTDSAWQLDRIRRSLRFTTRGRWSLSAIGVTTFLNLYWNGIVGVFVAELLSDFSWFLFFFLLPFEVIGLAMFAAWLFTITAPIWGMSYAFRLGLIEREYWAWFLRWKKQWTFDRIDHIEIGLMQTAPQSNQGQKATMFAKGDHELVLIDSRHRILLKIDSLTKGESLWMADALLQEHPEMFVR